MCANTINNELIEDKKQEIIDFIIESYPQTTYTTGVNNKFQTRIIISSKYEGDFRRSYPRKKRPNWEDDPRVWINIWIGYT